jgi:hypothetical protein
MIINLTPHDINIILGNETITIKPEGTPARVAQTKQQIDTVEGIPICKSSFGEVENLPPQKEGTIYIVSMLVANALPSRTDLYFPDGVVRSEDGTILGCTGLGRI